MNVIVTNNQLEKLANINYKMVQRHPIWLQMLHGRVSVCPGLQFSPIRLYLGCISTHQKSRFRPSPLNVHIHNFKHYVITCSPVTIKLPPMLTPRRPYLGEGRSAAGVHAEEPRVQVSVEEVYSANPLTIVESTPPPLTINTYTQNVTILWFT